MVTSPIIPMTLRPILFSARVVPALQAATIVTHHTGFPSAGFPFLDYESRDGSTHVAGIRRQVSNPSGSGADGDNNAFGNQDAYSRGGNVTYNFTEHVAGTPYAVYANRYGNGINNCAVDVTPTKPTPERSTKRTPPRFRRTASARIQIRPTPPPKSSTSSASARLSPTATAISASC